jgi:hypothetical protein
VQYAPTRNYGAAAALKADGDEPAGSGYDAYALARFDLSGVPAGTKVTAATLRLNVTNATTGVYNVYALKRYWSETQATWNAAQTGTSWGTAGAKATTDRESTLLGTASPSAVGGYDLRLNAAGVAKVQSWIDSPAGNRGLILASTGTTNGFDFSSRQAANAALRPTLRLAYEETTTLPPPPPDVSKLSWAPPVLQNAQTIQLGTGRTNTTLDGTKDYIVKLPASKKVGATVINGGRNVVIIGGRVTVPPGATVGIDRRAFYFRGQTGTIHLEGVKIDGSGGNEMDAIIWESTPQATLQVQNVRIDSLHGDQDSFHADAITGLNGLQNLRVDKFTAYTSHHGIFLNGSGPASATIKRADMHYYDSPLNDSPRGILGWWGGSDCSHGTRTLQEVYVEHPSEPFSRLIWPAPSASGCPAVISADGKSASWPGLSRLTGVTRFGNAPNGNFVPQGVAGIYYVSPGYLP